ncbi:MAG: zinc ABC transporter substrate-binding protein [Geminicoccaceae bacterium]|nr:MAG: zinc ABC transporter substrate-binding protein [Geminicoccaceae bacterium]
MASSRCHLPGVLAAAVVAGGIASAVRAAEPPALVASIVPLHALAAAVMEGVARPHLLVPPGASPHTFQLKPSEARKLQEADVVVWVGEALETFLDKPLRTLAGRATVVRVGELPGVETLPPREGGVWAEHGHAHGHGKDKGKGADRDREIDGHLWLDPMNGKAIVLGIAELLARKDPARAELYRANAAREATRIEALHAELEARLAPVVNRPFVVFHDAYQYFERRYGLAAAGSITVSPDRPPSAKRLAALRKTIRERGAVCVFAEPQFEAPIVASVAEGTGARTARLDPVGTPPIEPGPAAYRRILDQLGRDLVTCLAGPTG